MIITLVSIKSFMPDFYTYISVYRRFIRWEVKKMKEFGDWTPLFGDDEIVEWIKALHFDRCYPRIASTNFVSSIFYTISHLSIHQYIRK